MLTAYFDETGQEQNDWMFIAGYMGNDEAWKKFPSIWAKAIGPQREHLHMKALRFSKGPIRTMLKRAAAVPKECGLIPLLVGVRLRDYEDLLLEEEDWIIHSPYAMAFKAIITIAMRNLPENEQLEVVFERQDRYGWEAAHQLQQILEKVNEPQLLMEDGKTSKLASWRFIEKGNTTLCEPADFLAYAALQHARDRNSLKSRYTQPIIAAQSGEGYGALLQRSLAASIILNQKKERATQVLGAVRQLFLEEEKKRLSGETALNSH